MRPRYLLSWCGLRDIRTQNPWKTSPSSGIGDNLLCGSMNTGTLAGSSFESVSEDFMADLSWRFLSILGDSMDLVIVDFLLYWMQCWILWVMCSISLVRGIVRQRWSNRIWCFLLVIRSSDECSRWYGECYTTGKFKKEPTTSHDPLRIVWAAF